MVIALELCEGICGVMRCLCMSKKSLSSLTWTPLVVANLYMAMVLNIHELYHESYTFWIMRLHFRSGWLFDKDGSFYFFQQNNNCWKNIQVIFWSCFLVSWPSWRYHFLLWTPICIQILEDVFLIIGHEDEVVVSFPPLDGWTNSVS
jgi:hypothetical protein